MPSHPRRHALLRADLAWFAARTVLAIAWIEPLVAVLGFRRTLALVDRVPARRSAQVRPTVEEGHRVVAALYRLARVEGRCLPQALAEYAVHRRDRRPVRLVIGVRRGEVRAIDAHAWVEPIEAPLAEPGFDPIFSVEARGA